MQQIQPVPNQQQVQTYKTQLLTIALFNILHMPLKELAVIGQHPGQRVYLVAFQPHGTPDPVIPLATHNLGGPFNRATERLIHHMLSWHPELSYHSQAEWGAVAARLAASAISALHHAPLTQSEREYMIHFLSLAVAVPYVPTGSERRGYSQPQLPMPALTS